jgi:hypothetical protein
MTRNISIFFADKNLYLSLLMGKYVNCHLQKLVTNLAYNLLGTWYSNRRKCVICMANQR